MLCNRRVYNSTIQNCARNSEIDHGAGFNLRSSNWATRVHVQSAAIWRQDSVLSHLLYRYTRSVFDNQNGSICQNLDGF